MEFRIQIQPLDPTSGIGNEFHSRAQQRYGGWVGMAAVHFHCCGCKVFFMLSDSHPAAGREQQERRLTCSTCRWSCRRRGSLCTCPWPGWVWTSRCWGRSLTGSWTKNTHMRTWASIPCRRASAWKTLLGIWRRQHAVLVTSALFPPVCL